MIDQINPTQEPVTPSEQPQANVQTLPDYKAAFTKNEESGIVTATFTNQATGQQVFTISLRLKHMNWGLMRDIGTIQNLTSGEVENPMMALVDFFDKYMIGGAEAVPLDHTQTAFMAIAQYMGAIMNTTAKN